MKSAALISLLTCVLLAAVTAPARALFDVKDPLSKMYSSESRAVFSGTITAVDPETHVLTVSLTTVYKGPAPVAAGEMVKVQIQAPESLRSQAKVNGPIVVFKGAIAVAMHLADHWYSAQTLAKPNLFRINGPFGFAAHTAHDESFPGTTASLLQALDEIKAGKSTLLDAFPEIKFPAPQKIAMLPANAIAFTAVELQPGTPPIFLVATRDKLQALALQEDKSLKDRTEALGLDHLKPKHLARTPDGILVDDIPYTFAGGRFHPPASPAPSTGPGNCLAFVHDGEGPLTLYPGGIKRASADDDTRLTGTRLTDYYPAHANGFTTASLAAVDINGDHRTDLILATPEGTLTLLNRGFGCYLVNKDFAASLLDPGKSGRTAFPLLASTPKANPSTLWLLESDGGLYRCDFPAK